MSQLILSLPHPSSVESAAAMEFDYWLTREGRPDVQQGTASAALLPTDRGRANEVVLVLPAYSVAWYPVQLPAAVAKTVLATRPDPVRVRSILAGILEDQLLDDPAQLHFAVFPGEVGGRPEATDTGVPVWVAVCAAAPIRAAFKALEAADRPVSRLVVDSVPQTGPDALLIVTGTPGAAGLILANQRGVCELPLQPDSVAWVQAQGTFYLMAEPAVLELAEHAFDRRAELQTAAERILQSAFSDCNLAQGEFSPSQRGRLARRFAMGWQAFLRLAAWRPVRWALVALVAIQVVGLNALAWQKRNAIQQRQDAVRNVLTETFADIALVVDAPVQMRRALDALARTRGVGSTTAAPNVGRVLTVLATVDPDAVVSAIDLDADRLTLHVDAMQDAARSRKILAALEVQGWRVAGRDDTLQVQPGEDRP